MWAELGAAWSRKIPIVTLLVGMTLAELQAKPAVPIFLKKRDVIDLNDFDTYIAGLRKRVRA